MRLYTFIAILCLGSICTGLPRFSKHGVLKKKLYSKNQKKTNVQKSYLRGETEEVLNDNASGDSDSPSSLNEEDDGGQKDSKPDPKTKYNDQTDKEFGTGNKCWPRVSSEPLFKGLLELEERYLKDRTEYHEALKKVDIDGQMLKNMLETRAGARGLVLTKGLPAIPAGLNLGAHGMLKMPDSIMVFYRMKLRNDTHFTIKRFSSNMYSMAIFIKLALNDLHLIGDYDRSLTENDTATLYYRPTFGRVELLLKDATYMMEGRYRLLGGKLVVEHALSNITIPKILMLFDNDTCSGIKLQQENIDDYVSRMQVDFDMWLKDYVSDYLAFVNMSLAVPSRRMQEFEVAKQLFVNQYVDYVIKLMNNRLSQLNMAVARIPSFRIIAIDGTEFNLTEGFVEGLDTMYRRSVATEGGDDEVRIVDADISFSNLKVLFKYDAIVHEDIPQVPGVLILTGDDLEAHLQMGLVREPGFADLYISAIRQTKNESLIVEGAASRHIATYKHLLEHDIFAIMSNVLRHGVLSLNSLLRCYPRIKGDVETYIGRKLKTPIGFDALRSNN